MGLAGELRAQDADDDFKLSHLVACQVGSGEQTLSQGLENPIVAADLAEDLVCLLQPEAELLSLEHQDGPVPEVVLEQDDQAIEQGHDLTMRLECREPIEHGAHFFGVPVSGQVFGGGRRLVPSQGLYSPLGPLAHRLGWVTQATKDGGDARRVRHLPQQVEDLQELVRFSARRQALDLADRVLEPLTGRDCGGRGNRCVLLQNQTTFCLDEDPDSIERANQ